MNKLRMILVAMAWAFSGAIAAAQDVLLTIEADGKLTEFDRDALEKVNLSEFTTTTNWTEGEQSFKGVSLFALLKSVGIEEGKIRAVATNDYSVVIPVTDAVPDGPIIAIHRNGQPMKVRDNGPLWLVYPFDSKPAYQSEVIYSRSIWQLVRLEHLP